MFIQSVMSVIVLALVTSQSFGGRVVPTPAEQLAEMGVDTSSIDALKNAASSKDPNVRHLATKQLGMSGVDTTPYLKDPYLPVRIAAAESTHVVDREQAIAVLGDDYKYFTRNGIDKSEEGFKKAVSSATSDASLADALDVGKALAKLGDFRGVKLAELAVLQAPLEAQRYRGIWLLEEVATYSSASRKRAMGGLRRAAESEVNTTVLKQLVGSLGRIGGAEAALIVTVIQTNSPDENVKKNLEGVKARILTHGDSPSTQPSGPTSLAH